MVDPVELMERAIARCREGIAAGQSPFGCAIAWQGQIVAEHNVVVATTDITAHAEVTALRTGCRTWQAIHLRGAIVATTCEPCPMCMAALHWAQVDTVYYGATIADATDAGFNELSLPASELVRIGGSPVRLQPNMLSDACRDLFGLWKQSPQARRY